MFHKKVETSIKKLVNSLLHLHKFNLVFEFARSVVFYNWIVIITIVLPV